MPERRYVIEYTGEDEAHYRVVIERGRVIAFAVQYEAYIGEVWYRVVRYDTAHGYAHRDVLDAEGNTVRKEPLHLPYAEALQYAKNDIRTNWPRYREEFLRRMPR